MHRYKETIFQFLYVEILEEAKFKCGQTEINLNGKKKKKKTHLKFYKFGGLHFNLVWLQIVRIIM